MMQFWWMRLYTGLSFLPARLVMSLPNPINPRPKTITINGATYRLIAFYYPDYDTPWDVLYQGQFLTNFYPITFNFTHNNITGKFDCAEAAFQALKWWNTPHRQQFEGISGSTAYTTKKGLHNPDYSYAGFNSSEAAMMAVLTEKFSDPDLKKGLLATGDAYLLEHNEATGRDPGGWSDNHDGTGQNLLGQTLMTLRKNVGGDGIPAGNYTVADFTNQV
jgi:predicted NAD-dependent protein-ADP-ribosyltransferase YbiA (DUF1768 family)